MRFIVTLIFFTAVAFGAWYLWDNFPPIRSFIEEKIESGEFQTLEIRYTAEEIMESHKKELLKNKEYAFLEPKLMFHPYLLMDVKYSKESATTGEGLLLWGLMDGEMVLETANWEKTHGFEDCLIGKASKNDFKIIKALVESGGAIDRDRLYQKFKVDSDVLDDWIENCKRKKLIAISGNQFRLHFEDPRLEIFPVTLLYESLVTHPTKHSIKTKKKYVPSQIKKMAQMAFGHDFTIRKAQEIFLPVYNIAVQNPDGSILTTYWNALNGKQLHRIA